MLALAKGRKLVIGDGAQLATLTLGEEWVDIGLNSTNSSAHQKRSRSKRTFPFNLPPGVSVLWPNNVIPYTLTEFPILLIRG